MNSLRIALVLALAGSLLGASSTDASLAGVGKISFRMTVADAKKAEPRLARDADPEQSGPVGTLQLVVYRLDGQRFGELKGCTASLRFYNDVLAEVLYDCGNKARTEAALGKRLGSPILDHAGSRIWKVGEDRTVSLALESGQFIVADAPIMEGIQLKIYQAVLSGAAAGGTAAPGQAPPAAK